MGMRASFSEKHLPASFFFPTFVPTQPRVIIIYLSILLTITNKNQTVMKKLLLLFAAVLGGVISSSAATVELWSGEKTIDWGTNVIVIEKDKFASANISDILTLTISEATGGWPQAIICVPGSGTDLEGSVHRSDAGTCDVTITGDILRIAKLKGLQIKGDGMTITKVELTDGSYTDRPSDAIWVGESTSTFTLSRAHFKNASIEAGDIIKVNFSANEEGCWMQMLPSQKADNDYSWDTAYGMEKKYEANNTQFTVTSDFVSNKYNVVLQFEKYTITSVQIIKKDLAGSLDLWSGEQEFTNWDGFSIAASNFLNAKAGYMMRFTITSLFTNSWDADNAIFLVKNGDGWKDLSPKFESGAIPISSATPYTLNMELTQDVIDVAQINGLVIQGMGLTITKVELLPTTEVTIGSYQWATFSSDKALDFKGIKGITGYLITGHTGSAITKEEVTGSIPANTGLLLNADAGTYKIPYVASSTTDVSSNLLVAGDGSTISAESGKTKYVLGVSGDAATFLKIAGTAATVPVGKAYLQFNETISAPSLDFNDGNTTAIEAVEKAMTTDGVFYNIAGQRVAQPTKGLYIVNGKKVIIK